IDNRERTPPSTRSLRSSTARIFPSGKFALKAVQAFQKSSCARRCKTSRRGSHWHLCEAKMHTRKVHSKKIAGAFWTISKTTGIRKRESATPGWQKSKSVRATGFRFLTSERAQGSYSPSPSRQARSTVSNRSSPTKLFSKPSKITVASRCSSPPSTGDAPSHRWKSTSFGPSVRRRIPLGEGYPLDEHALEVGLTRLARTGYFKPIRRENIQIQLDDGRHTADISIRLEEIGQQRVTFDGGRAQFGSTFGLAYTVFDLLDHEELLTAKLEGGPESLQLLLGIAKEGIFGTRGSLAFSIFDNVIRPRFRHGVQGPFLHSRSEGISVPWTYALSNSDSFGVNYTLSRTLSEQTFSTPASSTSLPPIDLRSHTSRRSLGTAWVHDSGSEHLLFSDSASGSFLGGNENMVHASGETAYIFRDPLFASTNAWAFRTALSAAGSYRGAAPLYSRFFDGDEFVRGLRDGELGPVAMTERTTPSGVIVFSPSYAGANLITAANAEYRIPLRNGVEAAGFFDLGSGWLLPNWLGP